MNKKYNIAVVGSTGNVGSAILETLSETGFPIDKIYALASRDSIGREVSFGDKTLSTNSLEDFDFNKIDIAFFAAGSEISKEYAPKAAKTGCIVIDKSSFFRMDKDVPLIVPEANIQDLKNYKKKNIIANPNCVTIPLAVVLKPLDNAAKIKRLVISTYQSVSGAGRKAMDELYSQTKAKYVFNDPAPVAFPRPIAFNIFPHIGDFLSDGRTEEEQKIAEELAKIMGHHITASVTCVRVPVFVGHSMSVNVEFESEMDAEQASEILEEFDEITMISGEASEKYVTPIDIVGEDSVYVSRIRDDKSQPNCINMWVVCDNLRKGAALNGVQIAQELIKII